MPPLLRLTSSHRTETLHTHDIECGQTIEERKKLVGHDYGAIPDSEKRTLLFATMHGLEVVGRIYNLLLS